MCVAGETVISLLTLTISSIRFRLAISCFLAAFHCHRTLNTDCEPHLAKCFKHLCISGHPTASLSLSLATSHMLSSCNSHLGCEYIEHYIFESQMTRYNLGHVLLIDAHESKIETLRGATQTDTIRIFLASVFPSNTNICSVTSLAGRKSVGAMKCKKEK